MGTAGALLEAQFYIGGMTAAMAPEIARRDFRMELIVIALIGFELLAAIGGIVYSVRESKEQAQIMERQIQLLEKVEKAMIRAGNMNLVR